MMHGFIERDSTLDVKDAIYDLTLPAGEGWIHELLPGQTLRIVDLEGNQAVDTAFYSATGDNDNYSAIRTITLQQNIYLTTGSILRAISGKPMLEIVADKTGRHDTLGGCCSAQNNDIRYGYGKGYMENCRDTFMLQLASSPEFGLAKRDLVPNINFFMNAPVTDAGQFEFIDGISAPGKYVELKVLAHIIGLISNCAQMNNPCNAYNPTPIRILIWD